MKSKSGKWNIQELEIQEWLDTKQRGFLKADVEELKRVIEEDVNNFKHEEHTEEGWFEVINVEQMRDILFERFGIKEEYDPEQKGFYTKNEWRLKLMKKMVNDPPINRGA